MAFIFNKIRKHFPEKYILSSARAIYKVLLQRFLDIGCQWNGIESEQAKVEVIKKLKELKASGFQQIGLCPVGGFTLDLLHNIDLSDFSVALYDSNKSEQSKEVLGFPIYPLDDMMDRDVDCLFLNTATYHLEILRTLWDLNFKNFDRIFCPFFKQFRVIGLPSEEDLQGVADVAFVKDSVFEECISREIFNISRNSSYLFLSVFINDYKEENLLTWFGNQLDAGISENAVNSAAEINRICNADRDGTTVVFAAFRFAFNYIKHAIYLRKRGLKVILLALEDNVNEASSLDEVRDYFDGVFTTRGDWIDYAYILSQIKPSLVHVVSLIRLNEFALLSVSLSQAPCVIEYNDITSHGYTIEMLSEVMGAEVALQQFEMEKRVCALADGIIDKDRFDAVCCLLGRHGFEKQYTVFPSYAAPIFFIKPQPHYPLKEKFSIVYIGGINAGESLDAANPSNSLLKIIDIMAAQEIHFGIYNVYDKGEDERFDAYREKAEKCELFSYNPCCHMAEIQDRISNYSYGWMAFDHSVPDRTSEFLKTAMPSKFFTYIEAGIPVICSVELEYVCELIWEHEVGIDVSVDEFSNLSAILQKYQLQNLRRNVLRYREKHNMSKSISQLISFYKDICKRSS